MAVRNLIIGAFLIIVTALTTDVKGLASFYHDKFQGRKTASGEVFHQDSLTAASNQYPLGTKLVVWRVKNGDTFKIKITVTDRMSKTYGRKRKLDLSKRAMAELRGLKEGVIEVNIKKL